MWKCSKCGEDIGDDFEVCWACGTGVDGTEDPNFFKDEQKDDSLEPLGEGPPVMPPNERLVTVTTCNLPVEAHAIRIKLEAASIPAVLTDEFTVGMNWALANAVGGIKVQVAESNYAAACDVLGLNDDEDDEDVDDEDDSAGDDMEDEEEVKDAW